MRTAIPLLVILLILAAFLMRDTDRHHESYSMYVEEACEEQEIPEEEDISSETGEEEEQEQEEDVEGPGEDAVHEDHGSGGGQNHGGGGGQASSGGGGQTQEETPRYPYFMENGFYICKGCYMPFRSIRELNSHECGGITHEACEHDWVPEYHDVWIEERGHYEYGLITEAYDEPVCEERCVCKVCGAVFLTSGEAADHVISVHGNEGSWTVMNVAVSYIHHDAVYGEYYVCDEPARWERKVYRYHCSKCGEIKYPE